MDYLTWKTIAGAIVFLILVGLRIARKYLVSDDPVPGENISSRDAPNAERPWGLN